MNKYEKGMHGQQEAEKFLQSKNYKIRGKNYRTRTGEIDIIAQKESYIIFVEVKFRKNLAHGYPREAVGYAKQQKIIRTALHYISIKGLDGSDFRFDVVEILEQNGQMHVNHIKNAFDA